MASCPAFDPTAEYVSSLTGFVDCRVMSLGQDGYLAFAGSASFGILLGGLLTILIALFGYRLLLGETLRMRDGVLAAARIGIVLALSTQWPAYQALVYNVVIDGPSELSEFVAGAGQTPAGVTGQLDAEYQALAALFHPPETPVQVQPAPAPAGAGTVQPTAAAAPGQRISYDPRLSTATTVLLVSGLGGLLSVRIVAGLMLALGPLFIACLLFDGMRGLFEGWVRALAGAALASVLVTGVLALELAVLGPEIDALAQALAAGDPTRLLVEQIVATTMLFAVAILVGMIAAARAAAGFRLAAAAAARVVVEGARGATRLANAEAAAPISQLVRATNDHRSRATQIATTIRSLQSRDAVLAQTGVQRVQFDGMRETQTALPPLPLGQRHRPRRLARNTASASRRDGRL